MKLEHWFLKEVGEAAVEAVVKLNNSVIINSN